MLLPGYFHGFHLPRAPDKLPSSSRPSLPTVGLVRVHQRRLSLERKPISSSSIGIGPKVGFVYEEDFGATLLGLLSDLAVLEDEGFPRFILGFQEAFLGSLQHEAQPMEVVQATATTQEFVKDCLRKPTTFQFQLDNSMPASTAFLHR